MAAELRMHFVIPEGYEGVDDAFTAAYAELDAVEADLVRVRERLAKAVRSCNEAYTKLLTKLDPLPAPAPALPTR